MTIKEKVSAINKKHSYKRQVAMPVPQTVLIMQSEEHSGENIWDAGDVVYGSFYLNCTTMEQSSDIYDIVDDSKSIKCLDSGLINGTMVDGYCFAYDEELDMIVVFIGTFDISLSLHDIPTEWKEQCRFYVDRDKNVYVMSGDGSYDVADWHNSDVVYSFSQISQVSCICPYVSSDIHNFPDFTPVWKVFPKVITCNEGRATMLSTKHDFLFYLDEPVKYNEAYKDPHGFLAYSLADKQTYANHASEVVDKITKSKPNAMKRRAYGYENYVDYAKFFVMERVNCKEPLVCIRAFVLVAGPEMHEIHRFYFSADDIDFYESDNMGSFRTASLFDRRRYWADINLVGYHAETVQGTVIECLADILNSVPDTKKGLYIWAMLSNPMLEKLWKAGYSEYVRFLLDIPNQDSPEWMLRRSCGSINKSGKSIYSILGMNKYQTDILLNRMIQTGDKEFAVKMKSILSGIKYRARSGSMSPAITCEISISGIDQGSFDSVLELLDEMHYAVREYADIDDYDKKSIVLNVIDCAAKISDVWGMRMLIKSKKPLMLLCRAALKQSRQNGKPEKEFFQHPTDKLREYADYLHMIEDDTTGRFKPYFNHVYELSLLHNEALKSYKIKKNAELVAKVERAVKRVEKFSYENDKYRVIIPTCSEDFSREGDKLGHCVESYFNRVADGETNIMFIRKKSAPDKPFFTVEISDNGTIEQIHGFSNRNLDTEPDLIPFIREWQDKRGVVLRNIDKVR